MIGKRSMTLFPMFFFLLLGTLAWNDTFVMGTRHQLKDTNHRVLSVDEVRHCDDFRKRCLLSDCAFALGCAEGCGSDVKCLVRCKLEVTSEEGKRNLEEYEKCASEIASGKARTSPIEERKKSVENLRQIDDVLDTQISAGTFVGGKGDHHHSSAEIATKNVQKNSEDMREGLRFRRRRSSAKNVGHSIAGELTSMFSGGLASQDPTFADLEACVGCCFVWSIVKNDMGEGPFSPPAVEDSFESTCQDMPDVFYESCDDMMDQKGWLADTFIALEGDVETLCDESGICGNAGKEALFSASQFDLGKDLAKKMMTG